MQDQEFVDPNEGRKDCSNEDGPLRESFDVKPATVEGKAVLEKMIDTYEDLSGLGCIGYRKQQKIYLRYYQK